MRRRSETQPLQANGIHSRMPIRPRGQLKEADGLRTKPDLIITLNSTKTRIGEGVFMYDVQLRMSTEKSRRVFLADCIHH